MQRQRRTICLSVLALLVWVSIVVFIGEMSLFTSTNNPPKPTQRPAKPPQLFGKLAQDKIWREKIVYSILSTIKNKSRTTTDIPKEKKQAQINNKVQAKSLPVQNGASVVMTPTDSSVKLNSNTGLSMKTIAAIDKVNISAHVDSEAKSPLDKARKTNVPKVFKDEFKSSDLVASINEGKTDMDTYNHTIEPPKTLRKLNTQHITQNQTSSVYNTDIQRSILLNNASVKTRSGAYSVTKPYNISNSLISSNSKSDMVTISGRLHERNSSYTSKPLNANMFSKDYIPKMHRNETILKETIHFCVITARTEIGKEVEILVKSIILHARRADIMFHFVTDEGPHAYIANIFENMTHSSVNVSYEIIKTNLEAYLHRKLDNKVQITHPQSGIYGIGKIFMYDLLPDVDRCIIVDTDVVFATDPAFLWHELRSRLQPPVAVAVTMQKGDQYFNSGLMLQDLALMRKIKFGKLISMENCEMVKNKTSKIYRCYHDQLLLNTVMKHHSKLFDTFTVSWNLGLCFNFKNFTFKSFEDETRGLFFGAAHLSCLKHSNAIQGIKHVPNWKNLTEYVHYLEDTEI